MSIRILHIIESMGRGGAEIYFSNYINSLPPTFENIVVYLRQPHTLTNSLSNVKHIYCLDYSSKWAFVPKVLELSKIIKHHNPALIHSHLYWPTIFARLAKPKHLPLLFSVHNLMSYDAFNLNKLSLYMEALTLNKKDIGLFVSKAVLNDYRLSINHLYNHEVLYNFVSDDFFEDNYQVSSLSGEPYRLVAVGNLRDQKNFSFLLKSMLLLKNDEVYLDIYGDGPLRTELLEYIKTNNLDKVELKGNVPDMHLILKNYNAFVLSPKYEGFCLAMVEAMAVGLPCIVSDLDVLREVSGNTQLYFELDNPEGFVEHVRLLKSDAGLAQEFSRRGRSQSTMYRKTHHMVRLTQLYRKFSSLT